MYLLLWNTWIVYKNDNNSKDDNDNDKSNDSAGLDIGACPIAPGK